MSDTIMFPRKFSSHFCNLPNQRIYPAPPGNEIEVIAAAVTKLFAKFSYPIISTLMKIVELQL